MKYVITLAALFFLVWTFMNKASKRGKLSEDANKAVKSLAKTMRYFIIGLIVLGLIAFIFVFFVHRSNHAGGSALARTVPALAMTRPVQGMEPQ